MTVCLTADGLHGTEEIFALSRRSAHLLLSRAEALGIPVQVREMEAREGKAPALRFFSEQMLRYERQTWTGDPAPIRLLLAQSPEEECEAAAARVLELVREQGCRWREIAVAVRGFESYRAQLESTFRQYGVPLFVTRRSEVLSRPVPALIGLAYEIAENGWELDDMLSYLRTGLLDLTEEESDLLAGYLFLWQLRGAAWERNTDWRQHPDGYGVAETEESREKLGRINELRQRVSRPLLNFAERSGLADTAEKQAAALAELLEELRLPEQLEKRARLLEAEDRLELAAEYSQLWELTVSALEQCAAILGDTEMDRETFGRLFLLMLSQYDIGLIPVALDRVNAGDFDRMRRRNIRHLIVLGCSDDRLPPAAEGGGVFSDEERERLQELSIDLGSGEGELWREFSLIYHCLTLPSESLCLIAPLRNTEGSPVEPAYVYHRAGAIFGLTPETVCAADLRLSARNPALSMAATALRGVEHLGSGAQLKTMQMLADPANYDYFMDLGIPGLEDVIAQTRTVDMHFLGIDLGAVPKVTQLFSLLGLVPILSCLSTFALCWAQNRDNVLQREQSFWSQWGVSLFTVAFATYFTFLVPAGVGIYWIVTSEWARVYSIMPLKYL